MLAVAIVLVLSLVLALGFLLKTKKNVNVATIAETKLDEQSKISKKTLDWLDNQKDERGFYYSSIGCSSDFKCNNPELAGTSGHEGMPVLWARFKYYQQTKDLNELEKLKIDINNYVKGVETMEVQNDFWNCKLMYELWSSDVFDNDTKENIDKLCWTSTYLDNSDIESFAAINKEGKWLRTFTKVKNVAPEITLTDPSNIEIENLKDDMVLKHADYYASYISDFVARYEWKNNQDDLSLAKSTFNRVVSAYYSYKTELTSSGMCAFGVSSMRVDNKERRELYHEECMKAYWSVRQLERQINTLYYDRILASQDKISVANEISI